MKHISFYINKQEEKGNHIALCGWYLLKAIKNIILSFFDLWKLVIKLIRKYPISSCFVIIVIAAVACLIKVGQARTERDKYQHELYIVKQKLDQYEIIIDSRNR